MQTETPAAAGRAWRSVLAHIEGRLIDGDLRPGDHLPPERELAAALGVGRSSVREAIRVLEGFGLVRTQTGSGPRSGAIIIATPRGGMSALMRLQVAARGFPVADIVRTRLLIETSVAAELAAADGRADLADAAELLDAMDVGGLTPAEFLALDAQFHAALADATGNQVVTAIMAGLRTSIEGYALAAVPLFDDWGAATATLRREHRGILDAIVAGDPAGAADLVRAHIAGYYVQSGLAGSHAPALAGAGPPAGT